MNATVGAAPMRGALVIVPAATPNSPQHIPFQFNPAALRSQISAQTVGGEPAGHSELIRLAAAAVEILTLDLDLDAYNDMPNQALTDSAVDNGIWPQLAALEGILYPASADVEAAQQAANSGVLQVAPYVAPQVLLVLGSNRVVPIAIQSYRVMEQQFDANLNPVRATVTLTARVLTYSDVASSVPAYNQFLTYQKGREQLAGDALVNGMPNGR